MKFKTKRILSICLMVLFSVSLLAGQSASYASIVGKNPITEIIASFENVTGQYDFSDIIESNFNSSVLKATGSESQIRTVIVSLEGETLLGGITGSDDTAKYLLSAEGKRAERAIQNTQNTFYKRLKSRGIDFEKVAAYDTLDNAVAIKVLSSDISAIKNIAGVKSVVTSKTYAFPQTVKTASGGQVAVTNETSVYKTGIYNSKDFIESEGYSGQGTVVAILDTGLDYTHDAFRKLPDDLSAVAFKKSDIANIMSAQSLNAENKSAALGENITANDVYLSAKVPFAYDYADNDADVYPSYSSHGTHVAGIIAGNDDNYTNKDGELVNEPFVGVAPNAQLVICKVFTDNLDAEGIGGAESEDIIAALEDCVKLKVDAINMSLGTSAGFSTTDDGDDEGEYLETLYGSIRDAGISLICAASNDFSSGYGGTFGTNLASNPDSATVGSPSTYTGAVSVASIGGQLSKYMIGNRGAGEYESAVFYEESSDENSVAYDFAKLMLGDKESDTFEYVVVPGNGKVSDYNNATRRLFQEKGRIALIKRGENTFQEKVEIAMEMGAIGVIIYNNVAGKIRMTLGDIDDPIPTVSITLDAGTKLQEGARHDGTASNSVGTITVDTSLAAGPFMSDFSSWGCTPDLKLKPEITAHGGEITSAVPGGYGEQSGTSMATPNITGFTALLRSYVKGKFNKGNSAADRVEIARISNQLMMSTATIVHDENDLPYSPRKQGAGLASLANVTNTNALLKTDNKENDYRPKLEFGDDANKHGEYTGTFVLENFGNKSLNFSLQSVFMTETLAIGGLAVAEKAHLLTDIAPVWKVDGVVSDGNISVAAGQSLEITVTLKLSDAEKKYIDDSFKNGMFVEGFVKLVSDSEDQCDLTLPYLGFYGDWAAAPLLDYSAFEVSRFEQDSSIKDEEKPKASVWATQAYSSYYNNKYVIPMGSYMYVLPDDADPMYVDEEHCAISRFNDYVSEDGNGNYMTSTRIQALYAGLIRNARTVNYKLSDADTGELILEDTVYRVGKAYAAGGSTRPSYVELKIAPEEYGLVSNGHYTMDFEFNLDADGEGVNNNNTFSFSFYVDYEAPILQDTRVRFYNYKDGNKEKQRIYLDLDVYDNHYAQSVMLSYLDTDPNTGNQVIKLITDYITPIRNAVKNGKSTVSIEITDLYEQYKDRLFVQIDDYALNHSVYRLNLNRANNSVLPETFDISEDDKSINLDIYESRKVSLNYDGSGDLSNFTWSSNRPTVANVKNGEIVGLRKGTAKITVSNGSVRKTIDVNVSDTVKRLQVPSFSFGTMENADEAIVKASGIVEVHPNTQFKLDIETDPWYYPKDTLELEWSSTNNNVVTVDQNGNVTTLKKGTASIMAKIRGTSYSTSVTLRVGDEFVVRNFALVSYHGPGGKVVIPSDKNILYIEEEAFEYNDNVTEVVIPKTVMEIREKAFINCSALQRVSFIQDTPKEIADANLSLINRRAFYNCKNLTTVDLSNVKTITVAREAFANCTKLETVIKMTKIGTMYDSAFENCSSLKEADVSGLHVSGNNVFKGCSGLKEIKTDRFTAIGSNMFENCTDLTSVVLKTPNIGSSAFKGCNLTSVTFEYPDSYDVQSGDILTFNIGNSAFEGCTALNTVNFNGCNIRSIGDGAFANTALTEFALPCGIERLGSGILRNSRVTKITLNDTFDISSVYGGDSPFADLRVSEYAVSAGSEKYAVIDGIVYNKQFTELLLVPSEKQSGFENIPGTVTKIAANAFYGSKAVEKFVNGALYFKNGDTATLNLLEIGDYAFAESSIESIELSNTAASLGVGAFYSSQLKSVIFAEGSVLKEIPAYAFTNTKITSAILPQSVISVGDYAFANTPISTFEFNGKVLGSRVFQRCTMLTDITLFDGITQMGSYTFEGCSSLESVTMPSVIDLGGYTFLNTPDLKSVTFGRNAETMGYNTFYSEAERPNLKTVVLGDKTEEIGYGAFYNCTGIESINLENIKTVSANAFVNCSALENVSGMENVKHIGAFAFAGTAVKELNLQNAEYIGISSFLSSGLTAVSMPNVKRIEDGAFENTGISAVTLPESVEYVGYGAFADCRNFTEISLTGESEMYFTDNGVLYRYLTDSSYELVSYPSGRQAQEIEGLKTYSVKDGTVSVGAYAFAGLNENSVDKVILPYSLKVIGDGAFYLSGIKEYTFNSINAPSLESGHRQSVESLTETVDSSFKGFFYANFQTLFVNYTEYGTEKTELILNVPTNGVGYDNYVYSTYFAETNSIGVLMDDYTRETKEIIENLLSPEEVEGMMNLAVTPENKAKVENLSEIVKNARLHYNNITDSMQLAFIGNENYDKLAAVEMQLRNVKNKFSIPVSVERLRLADSNSYKKEYKAGETFDMTGLKIDVIYDDGSVSRADISELTLVSDEPLSVYDRTVELSGYGTTIRVAVTVTEYSTEDSSSSSSESTDSSSVNGSSSGSENGNGCNCGGFAGAEFALIAVMLGCIAVFELKRKQKIS